MILASLLFIYSRKFNRCSPNSRFRKFSLRCSDTLLAYTPKTVCNATFAEESIGQRHLLGRRRKFRDQSQRDRKLIELEMGPQERHRAIASRLTRYFGDV